MSFSAFSQIHVKEGSFRKIPGYVMLNKESHIDDNEAPMALIKITTENITAEQRARFIFKGNAATYFDVHLEEGETYLYISAAPATFLEIIHPDYGKTEYWFPVDLCDFCGYEMVVVSTFNQGGKDEPVRPQNNFLTISTDQQESLIYIDGVFVGNGTVDKSLQIGKEYEYTIECDLYHTETGKVKITEGEPLEIPVVMRPAFGYINVSTSPEQGAKVYIDGKNVGTTPYKSGKLASGSYKVKVVKAMFSPKEQTFVVTDGNTTQADMTMTANFVNLTVDTDTDADIYIDEEYKGRGKWSGRVSDGTHYVEARKESHKSTSKNVNLVLGKDETISLDSPKPIYGFLELSSSPSKADIYIDGRHYGQTPRVMSNLLIGEHELKLTKSGNMPLVKKIDVKENETLVLHETLKAEESVVERNPLAAVDIDPDMSGKKQEYKKETMYDYLKNGIKFLTLDGAYTSPSTISFGFTYGHTGRYGSGWYVSALSNKNFKPINKDMSDNVTLSGEKALARFSLTGGYVTDFNGEVIALRFGAGYGMRVMYWEDTQGNWYKNKYNTHYGLDLSAGLQVNLRHFTVSADIITTNFMTLEFKLGIGTNWR